MERPWDVDILVFGAHPDDAEIGAGGMMAREARLGRKIVICDLTAGEMSSNGTPDLRRMEALASADTLGVFERVCLGLPDRGLRDDEAQVAELVRVIREFRPLMIFTPWHEDNHPDHVQTTRLVRAAQLNARLRHYGTAKPWTIERVWEYFIHEVTLNPVYLRLEEEDGLRKQAALSCYLSQFQGGDGSVPTRLLGLPQQIEWRDRYAGSRIGVPWAEGFWQLEPLSLSQLWDVLV